MGVFNKPVKSGLELVMLLSQPLQGWASKHSQDSFFFFKAWTSPEQCSKYLACAVQCSLAFGQNKTKTKQNYHHHHNKNYPYLKDSKRIILEPNMSN